MSGRASRDKGGRGEREAISLLQPVVDGVCEEAGMPSFELVRDSRQRYQKKLYDIFGLPWFAFEIKRVENQSGIGGWWRQVREATKEGQIPVLMYRQNNRPWMVRTKVSIPVVKGGPAVRMTVTMTFDDWKVWFREFLRYRLVRDLSRKDPVVTQMNM